MGQPLNTAAILERLASRYGDKVMRVAPPGGGEEYGVVDREHVVPVLDFLKQDAELGFNFLVDVTCVDHLLCDLPAIGARFSVVYQLYSMPHNHRFRLKARVPGSDPRVPSACGLWKSALWAEREVHDMFGVEFDGNPDLRRLLMPQDYPGYPLRKDYPLRGRGERDAFEPYRPAATAPATPPAASQPS